MSDFADRLLTWFDRHGRHDLPWQHPRTPYRVWVSEIMLQQTQVQTVIPYFERFMAALPDLPALATADLDRVLSLWSGLGYYARARNLHAAARRCLQDFGGDLPRSVEDLSTLPGIGRSTAGAILAQAHGERVAILDGNVKRVLCRYHAVEGWPGGSAVEKRLWELSDAHLPQARLADYTQAVMDFGATLCSRAQPACAICPLQDDCRARALGLVEQLPTPKPGKALPRRETVMLVLRDGDRVLLSRRPPTGVWASLWSLPESGSADALPEHLAAVAETEPAGARALPHIEHVFSHFRLDIHPLLLPARERGRGVGDNDDLRWQPLSRLDELGLPAPVRKLLRSLD